MSRRLRFESILGVRHLTPVAEHWEELPPRVLELLCGLALQSERAARNDFSSTEEPS